MRINLAIPEAHVKAPVLDAALEGVTRLNESLIRAGASPTSHQLIRAGAKWKPEPPGQEHFDHGALIASRGHGDCDDWAPLHAATLRVTGKDPGATAIVRKSGPQRWHAIVRRSDGKIEDPSLAAGMPGRGRSNIVIGVRGATVPLMLQGHGVNGEVGAFINSPQLAMRPKRDEYGQIESWQARADLPWHWKPGKSPTDIAMVSLHQSPVSDQAIVGAIRGAWRLGVASGTADPNHLRRLAAIADMCEGCDYEEVARRYGAEHAEAAGAVVGSFFGKAFRSLKKVAKKGLRSLAKVAPSALSFVPGVGPVARLAFKAASPLLRNVLKHKKHIHPVRRALPPATARRVVSRRPVRRVVRRAAPRATSYPPGTAYPSTGGGLPGFWCTPAAGPPKR